MTTPPRCIPTSPSKLDRELVDRTQRALSKLGPLQPAPSQYSLRRPFQEDVPETSAHQQRARVLFRNG